MLRGVDPVDSWSKDDRSDSSLVLKAIQYRDMKLKTLSRFLNLQRM